MDWLSAGTCLVNKVRDLLNPVSHMQMNFEVVVKHNRFWHKRHPMILRCTPVETLQEVFVGPQKYCGGVVQISCSDKLCLFPIIHK